MTFTSEIFIIGILPWFILFVYLTRNREKSKTVWLILANSIFYVFGGIKAFVFVCCFSTIVWLFTIILRKHRKRYLLWSFLLVLILPLCVSKYSDKLMMIGISFFTFEAIALLVDIFQRKIEENVSIIDVFLYLTFFATITAGPILRYSVFKEGLLNKIEATQYSEAIERIVLGLSKKVLIADKLAVLSDYYFDGLAKGNLYSCIGLWMGSIAYTLQLYFDFSGYSDMAIGIGKLLGFDITENFNCPYHASSISGFWRRWHITLSQWFRDYVYIPLGGSRCSRFRNIFNLLIVWILTGIWHGADWTFLVWGMGYFILLVIERYIPGIKKMESTLAGHIYTLFFVNLLWVPFRADDLDVSIEYIMGMFGIGCANGVESKTVAFLPFLMLAIILCLPWKKWLVRRSNRILGFMRGTVLVIITIMAMSAVINAKYMPYLYGKF